MRSRQLPSRSGHLVFDLDAWRCGSGARHADAAESGWAEDRLGYVRCADCALRAGWPLSPGRPEGVLQDPWPVRCDGCGRLFVDERAERSHVYGQGFHALHDAAVRRAWAEGWRGGPHPEVDRLRTPHPDRDREGCRYEWLPLR